MKLHCDHFSLRLKLLRIIVNSNFCDWILIVLKIFGYYFSMLSANISCTAAVISDNKVLVDYGLNVISIFLSYFSEKMKWNRDHKKISSHNISLSVLFAKFVNSDDSISHNGIIESSKCSNDDILMIFLKTLIDKMKN